MTPQVGVPVEVAKVLTYPEPVTHHNKTLMQQLLLNGPDVHPGALFLTQKSRPDIKKSVRHLKKSINEVAKGLRVGDVIER